MRPNTDKLKNTTRDVSYEYGMPMSACIQLFQLTLPQAHAKRPKGSTSPRMLLSFVTYTYSTIISSKRQNNFCVQSESVDLVKKITSRDSFPDIFLLRRNSTRVFFIFIFLFIYSYIYIVFSTERGLEYNTKLRSSSSPYFCSAC